MKSDGKFTRAGLYPLVFGLFLGLAILKFGNPVILDQKIAPPASPREFWTDAWPPHWANWFFWPLALVGAALMIARKSGWPGTSRLWLLPLLWFGWQLFSATETVDGKLTAATLCQFAGCLACYFIGALVLGRNHAWRWLLIGVLAAFTICLVRGINQRLFEFPASRQLLLDGERAGWTNIPPAVLLEMKRDLAVINTNGVDVPNPVILDKFAKGRVMGTLVYPNALAGLILLLLPVSLVLVDSAKRLRLPVRMAAMALTIFLGGAAFFWTGSKLGWLIAMLMGGACLFRLPWPARLKWTALVSMMVIGLGIFAWRFHGYFAAGATSAGARFGYWRVAVKITGQHPLLGTGPGTFQRPYAQLKSPADEMARLAHNDFLEQFSDSGVIGGMLYVTWVVLLLWTIGRRIWSSGDLVNIAIFLGVSAWFIQGLAEFSFYVPALAWTAYALLGVLLAATGNQIDKHPASGYSPQRT